jgi:hypothetical protein
MSRMLQASLFALALAMPLQAGAASCGNCTPAEAAKCKAKEGADASCAKKCAADGAKCAHKTTEDSKKNTPAPRPAPASPSSR